MKVAQFVKVSPMDTRGNQMIIEDPIGYTFFSYGTHIAYVSKAKFKDGHQIILDSYFWNYSRTTDKYRNKFLGFNIKECRRRIANGSITLKNLNKNVPTGVYDLGGHCVNQ